MNTNPTIPNGTKEQDMSEELKPCPFCGSTNLGSGGDDKTVGYWCKDCQAVGPNHYGNHEWNQRAKPHLHVDQLANIIRAVDGDNIMGAGELATAIVTSLEGYDD